MECRVGLPADGKKRFRCDICSLLNMYDNDVCKRCQEPYNKERKDANIIRNNINTRPVVVKSIHKNKSQKITKNNYNNNKIKKLQKHDMSEKHLGYKTKKKGNIKTAVKSKLNYDTASYRAKFDDKNLKNKKVKINGMKGNNYATINELTRNGFQTSIKSKNSSKNNNKLNNKINYTKNKIKNLHDERPVTPPPNKGKSKKRGLIDRLQKAHSGEIMANLRQGGRYIKPVKKSIEGEKTVYAL